MNLILEDGTTVELTPDATGWKATADLNGERSTVHLTVTATGPAAVSPAKARLVTA